MENSVRIVAIKEVKLMKKISKSGIITTIVIYIFTILLLNVFTFLVPFEKKDSTILGIAYGCAMFVIIGEFLITLLSFFIETNDNQKILGLPIVYSGFIALIIQLIATSVFYLCNAFIVLPIWVVIVVEMLIFAYFGIQIAIGFFFKKRNEEYHEDNANTKFMDEFRARLKGLLAINRIESISEEMEDLVDIARGSDPVTNDKTLDSESELLSLLQDLDESIKNGSESDSREIIIRIKNILTERNVLCKSGK